MDKSIEKSKKGTVIQSLQVGMSIVDLIAKYGKPIKFTDIYEHTKITKSNLYKYLNTLTQLQILYRDRESNLYSLGSKLTEYGMAAIDQEDVVGKITSYLQEINRTCNETVIFAVWTYNGPMVVKIINGNRGLNIGAQIGSYLPLFSATGKLFSVFQDERETQYWREKELEQFGDYKINLEKELVKVRTHKISFASEPLVPQVSSVSLPVFNYCKNLIGAFTVVGFTETVPKDIDDELARYLIEKSEEISQVFGYEK